MSGTGPKLLGASTTATGVALLPNTGSNGVLFWVAVAALAIGLVTMAVAAAATITQRMFKA